MARRVLGTVLFTVGILMLVAASMFAGAVLWGLRGGNLAPTPCTPAVARPPTLLERAQKRLGLKIYSQWNEETLIRHFFNDERDGFFVDVGAAACCSNSTTYYLESRLGWIGLAVDANASYGPEYKKRRRGSRFFSYFVSDTSDKVADFFLVKGVPDISSGDRKHLRKFAFMREHPPDVEETKISTITLDRLLEREHVTKIDFLSLDIEGAELAALRGLDIEKYKPRLVCVEIQKELSDAIYHYFEEHGYRQIEAYRPFDRFNGYFAPAAIASDFAKRNPG